MPSNGLKILEWNNERIAALSIATTDERTRGPHNPAGWEFEPPLVNFKDRTEVRQRFQDYMNRVISQMLETKMRGGIFLNLDGMRFTDEFLGCPDLALTLNPELEGGILLEISKMMRDNNLLFGLYIRPSEFDFLAQKLRTPLDCARNLLLKIRYAYNFLKARLFYIAGPGLDPDPDPETNSGIFKTLRREFPNCLFIPVHENALQEIPLSK